MIRHDVVMTTKLSPCMSAVRPANDEPAISSLTGSSIAMTAPASLSSSDNMHMSMFVGLYIGCLMGSYATNFGMRLISDHSSRASIK